MLDLRPVGYVIGLLVAVLGVTMLIPMGVDLWDGNPNWSAFLESALVTGLTGAMVALACASGSDGGLSIRQTFLLTSAVWLALPVFAGLPFVLGLPEARPVDAFFEAMSGLTTTGATVFTGLDALPRGTLMWRSMLQWFGGIGIIVVAMVFLPELKVGGMQIFRSEAFETGGKVLPRAVEIAAQISGIYLFLTIACMLCFTAVGMPLFDALNHALTTVSTGGFSTHDASFGLYQGVPEYVASVFMVLASLPFVRYVQLLAGQARPILRDSQIWTYLSVIAAFVLIIAAFRVFANGDHYEHAFREGVFNVTSIISGTGFASTDYQLWGALPVILFFFIGLIGGCAGSTACSIKIFRYQLLFSAIRVQIKSIYAPHGIFQPRYDGRRVDEDVLSSVMSFFVYFVVALGIVSVLLGATGLDATTALSGAATTLGNIGPGLGDQIGPSGNFAGLNDIAKWILSMAMFVGRLELLVVFAIFTVQFWRA
ncbi:TrkH family potassium uptake protein [Rhodovulum sp. BSW8]|uniref:Trk system potassium uptake protein n=1 Tax=Rhodovulum visakhapatnamense TaxID=364297 RepID=A0A4R8G7E6_9RHOB|nr:MULTISPECIES: TrkH family potassium uptake protein [Rhodovulum]MBL3569262.1 TrkH family potassium uptake protein [Rhodovulum visakhapatnamense]MBL3580051.1 TrkH family potassium uptake protein [Rhodovulum visakhapatnamense]RBO51390.1 TrkH family potassium uptake protein [Rhodovulum sp. BSW8]TDX31298.1 trk system potassium uptake protein TrkH [Rhodovulum visakhapatnamense]